VTIPVTADGVAMDQTVDVHCDHPGTPAASATDDCTDTNGTITVTLRNTDAGSQPVEFVVTNPIDQTTVTKTVAAGGTETVTFTDVPDGSYLIPVTADGKALTPIAVTVSCQETPTTPTTPTSEAPTSTSTTQNPNVVLGAELERTPEATATGTLPTTGSASTSLVLLAGVFLVAGGALVVIGRRRTA
jgi:LPXTG-motif cell wall-anchored protein